MSRILYIASSPGQHGPSLTGERLVRRLTEEHEVRVAALVVPPTPSLLQNHYAEHVVVDSDLHEYDAIVMEGGWNGAPDPAAPLAVDDAARFVRSGGVLIVCDMARDTTNQKLEAVLAAASLLRAVPNHKDGYLYYLQDDLAREPNTGGFWFAPAEMQVDERADRGLPTRSRRRPLPQLSRGPRRAGSPWRLGAERLQASSRSPCRSQMPGTETGLKVSSRRS